MYSNKNAEFDNKLTGHILISDYSGSFDVMGITAIVADVLDKTKDLSHWIWYQRPSPSAGITPQAIDALITRYKYLDRQGCVGLGILNQNVLVNAFRLPSDGSIAIPVKISREEKNIFHFFQGILNSFESISSAHLEQKRKSNLKADADDIQSKFLSSCNKLKISETEGHKLIGQESKDVSVLSVEQINAMQAVMILERLVLFRFDGDEGAALAWFDSNDDKLGFIPRAKISSATGLYDLLKYVNDSKKSSQSL